MWFLTSGFHTITFYTFILSPIHATCPTYIILLNIIIIIILLDEYKPLSYSLSSFIQSPVTFSLCSPNVPLSTALYRTECLASSPACALPLLLKGRCVTELPKCYTVPQTQQKDKTETFSTYR
jgi:hypothetical protein